jgi:hypothetical protein
MKVKGGFKENRFSVFRRPGGDLLFRVLRRSTIGAYAVLIKTALVIYGRVRDGIGYGRPAKATRPAKDRYKRFALAKSPKKHIENLNISCVAQR